MNDMYLAERAVDTQARPIKFKCSDVQVWYGDKHAIKDVAKVFKGPRWKHDDYRDLLCLLFALIRISRSNPVDTASKNGAAWVFSQSNAALAVRPTGIFQPVTASVSHSISRPARR